MADRKISQLPAADTLTSADVLPLVQGTTTAKVSLTQLDSRWISSSSGGSITGGLTVSQYIAVGANPATGGAIRLPNNQLIFARNAAGTADVALLRLTSADWVQLGTGSAKITEVTGLEVRIATTAGVKLGFFNTNPVTQRTGTPAAATDPATTMALVNSLRASLIALGLIS